MTYVSDINFWPTSRSSKYKGPIFSATTLPILIRPPPGPLPSYFVEDRPAATTASRVEPTSFHLNGCHTNPICLSIEKRFLRPGHKHHLHRARSQRPGQPPSSLANAPPGEPPLSEGLSPNDLWCTDYKREFMLAD